jgi:hypothetical protein
VQTIVDALWTKSEGRRGGGGGVGAVGNDHRWLQLFRSSLCFVLLLGVVNEDKAVEMYLHRMSSRLVSGSQRVVSVQVCVEVVGYLLEELRDGKNYESFKADMADANVFIGSLIFIEELADKV